MTELCLRGCGLSSHCTRFLEWVLVRADSPLQALDVSCNFLGDRGCTRLAPALRVWRAFHPSSEPILPPRFVLVSFLVEQIPAAAGPEQQLDHGGWGAHHQQCSSGALTCLPSVTVLRDNGREATLPACDNLALSAYTNTYDRPSRRWHGPVLKNSWALGTSRVRCKTMKKKQILMMVIWCAIIRFKSSSCATT